MTSAAIGNGESSPPQVSVIIVNWNTRVLLRECLDSIRSCAAPVTIETIVVDNRSCDGSVEMVANDFPEVKLIQNENNLGFAAANNQGIQRATGRYILLLNSDAVLKPGSLERVVSSAQADPTLGVVACRVLNRDGSLQISCMRYPDFRGLLTSALFLPRLFPNCSFLGYEDLTWWAHDVDREVQVLKGCFLLVRSEAVREVGALDESFWLFGEETDWCYRMRKAGWGVRFTARAEIVHYGGASTEQLPADILHQLWGAKLQFIRKYRSGGYHLICCCAVGFWFAIRILSSFLCMFVFHKLRTTYRNRAVACSSGLQKLIRGGSRALVRSQARTTATAHFRTCDS